jgi:hypothetical protein
MWSNDQQKSTPESAAKPRKAKTFKCCSEFFLLDNKSCSDLYFRGFARCGNRSVDSLV